MPPTNHLANGGFQSSTLPHGARPVQQLGLLGPEPFRVVLGSVPQCLVLFQAADVGLAGEEQGEAERPRLSCNTLVIEPPPGSDVMVVSSFI